MSLEQFGRQYKLTIGVPNTSSTAASKIKKSVVIDKLHIEFEVKITADSKNNTLELQIYNLSKEDIALFDTRDVLVSLEVAYKDSPFSVLFRGEKASMKTERRETEVITTVIAAEGYVYNREGRLQSTIGEGATLKDVLKKLVSDGYPDIKVVNISPDIPEKVYNKGYSASGSSKSSLDKVCKENSLMWHIEKNETINIFPIKGDTKVKALVISPRNGLISTPEKTSQEVRQLKDDLNVAPDTGIRFECLLNPLIKAGQIIQIQDTFNSDGNYRVDSITHRGSYEGDDWTTIAEATRF
jgi:hypothetical protein